LVAGREPAGDCALAGFLIFFSEGILRPAPLFHKMAFTQSNPKQRNVYFYAVIQKNKKREQQ
jgi:hypothetical protein